MGWAVAVPAALGALGLVQQHHAQREAEKAQKRAETTQKEQIDKFNAIGKPFVDQGQESLGMYRNYLQSLASGNRSLMMETMAPELNMMAQGQQGAVQGMRSQYPRGGIGAAQASQLPFQFQGQVNNMISAARPQAMQQLGQLGGNMASLGLGAMGQGAGLTNSMLDYGLRARDQMNRQSADSWSGIGNMFMNAYLGHQMGQTAPPAAIPSSATSSFTSPPTGYFGAGTPSNNIYTTKP